MHLLDSFERKIIFPLMRIIAILAIIGLLVAAAASIVGALIGPAGAAEPPAKEQVVEPPQDPEGAGGIAERAQGIKESVSEVVIMIKERAPDVKGVAVAAKGYAAGAIEQFRQGVVFGTLATVDWMLSVLFVAVAAVLMGFFTLILVFLAIERNTRRNEG
jgi:hypothetical protein